MQQTLLALSTNPRTAAFEGVLLGYRVTVPTSTINQGCPLSLIDECDGIPTCSIVHSTYDIQNNRPLQTGVFETHWDNHPY